MDELRVADLTDEELLDSLFRVLNELEDWSVRKDVTGYALWTVRFQDLRSEILRRMRSG